MTPPAAFPNPRYKPSHFDLVARAVPPWLANANSRQVRAYQAALHRSRVANARLAGVNQHFANPVAFCEPLLSQAFKQTFNRDVDVARDQWVRVDGGSALLGRPLTVSRRTLLEAAMANFTELEGESGHFGTHTLLMRADALRLEVTEEGKRWRYGWHYHARDVVPVPPEHFAALCRRLDMGKAYQQHFDDVYRSATNSADPATVLQESIGAQLHVSAHEALLQGHIDAQTFAMLQKLLGGQAEPVLWRDSPVVLCSLRGLVTWTHSGSALPGLLSIQAHDGIDSPCVIYMPGEPDAPLKQYATFTAFTLQLREKLRDAKYQAYFAQYVAQAEHSTFFTRLIDTLAPRPLSLGLAQPRVQDPDADIGLRLTSVSGAWVQILHATWLEKHRADAAYFVVTTAGIDQIEREARHALYRELGLNALNVAGLFVPGLGVLMAAVGTAQLLKEVFVGIDDWTHGQTEEAVTHFFDVAANVALLGATVAAGVGLQRSPFVAGMLPVVDAAGQSRLWPVQLEAFAVAELPAQMPESNAIGQFYHDGQPHIRLDTRLYRQRYDAQRQQWLIEHSSPEVTWRIALEHNGDGAWRMAHETPLKWSANQALRRFGPLLDGFDEQTLQRIRRTCGLSGARLRRLHASKGKLPAAVKVCIADFRAQQNVMRLPLAERSSAIDAYLSSEKAWPQAHPAAPLQRDFPELPRVCVEEILAGANPAERKRLQQGRVPLRLALQAREQGWAVQLNRSIAGLLPGARSSARTLLLREGLLATLPAEQRAQVTDSRVYLLAVEDRHRAARLIGQRRPALRGPQRLADGRIGYRLSGRRPPGQSAEPASALAYAARQAQRDAEYARLDTALGQWVEASASVPDAGGEPNATLQADRMIARQRILAAWRGDAPRVSAPAGQPIQLFLDLTELRIGALPVVFGDFSQVGYLSLEDSGISEVSPGFLRNFPQLKQLDLQGNLLTRIPADITDLRHLQSLSLDDNRLISSDDMFAGLAELPDLEALILRNNPMRLPAPAIEQLSQVTGLRYLALSNTDHVAMAEHLTALARLPNLESLWLRGNQMVLTPQAMQALQTMESLDYLDLSDNPLGAHLDLTRLPNVGALNLRRCQLTQWPDGLTQLMDRRPPVLRWVTLEDNPIHEVPELHELAFFNGQVERPLNMTLANLSRTAQLRLQAVGITFDYLEVLASNTDAARLARLAQLQADPQAQRLLQILRRLSETADFRLAPDNLAARAWSVIDGAQSTSSSRAQLLGVAGRPDTCADQVIVLFGDLEQSLLYARADDPSLDNAQRANDLLDLSRSLFRLDRLNRIAQAQVRSRAAELDVSEDEIDELEVVLAYRIGLAERLGLRHQPQAMLFGALEPVTRVELDRAATQVLAEETREALVDWHMAQEYWVNYLRRHYNARLQALSAAFDSRREALAVSDYDDLYDERLVALQVEESAAQSTLLRELTEEAMGGPVSNEPVSNM